MKNLPRSYSSKSMLPLCLASLSDQLVPVMYAVPTAPLMISLKRHWCVWNASSRNIHQVAIHNSQITSKSLKTWHMNMYTRYMFICHVSDISISSDEEGGDFTLVRGLPSLFVSTNLKADYLQSLYCQSRHAVHAFSG